MAGSERPQITLYENLNPGPTGTNTGVVQFGAGLDVWLWHTWGGRSARSTPEIPV